MHFILFILGFILTIKGADWLVDGSKSIASRMGISELLIGLTVVSIGTSMPELVVSLIANVNELPDLTIGNVLGSNIANVLLILGISAVIRDLPIQRNTVMSEIPFSLAAALLLGFLANASILQGSKSHLLISRWDGVVILFFFMLFMSYIFIVAKEDKQVLKNSSNPNDLKYSKSIVFVVLGVIALFIGGKWIVDGAVTIAYDLGMSEAFIGLTIVSVGTSLPELFTSVNAASKNHTDLAVGNVIGSNIFNILWILGLSALVNPLEFDVASNFDILVVIASSSMILLVLILNRKKSINRVAGILFLLCYIGYLFYITLRG